MRFHKLLKTCKGLTDHVVLDYFWHELWFMLLWWPLRLIEVILENHWQQRSDVILAFLTSDLGGWNSNNQPGLTVFSDLREVYMWLDNSLHHGSSLEACGDRYEMTESDDERLPCLKLHFPIRIDTMFKSVLMILTVFSPLVTKTVGLRFSCWHQAYKMKRHLFIYETPGYGVAEGQN